MVWTVVIWVRLGASGGLLSTRNFGGVKWRKLLDQLLKQGSLRQLKCPWSLQITTGSWQYDPRLKAVLVIRYVITKEPTWHTDSLLIFMLWTVRHLGADGLFCLAFNSVLVHDIIWQWQQYLKYHTTAIKDKAAGKKVADENGGCSM
jgi:hypothetical protein